MPPVIPIIGNAVNALVNYFKQQQTSRNIDLLWRGAIVTAQWIGWFADFVGDVFGAAKGGENASEEWSGNAAGSIEKIGSDLKDVTEHTYNTVLPNSLSWLRGNIYANGINPIRREITSIEKQLGTISGRVSVLEFWRKDYADPHIRDWRIFNSWFHTYPIGVVNLWHEWFQHPHEFALWAAAPLIGPLVSYLAAPEHKDTRDNLALIMVQSWQEVPNRVWEDVLDWMVTES